MEKQTVFIKRYPSKGEFPKEDGIISLTTNCGILTYSKTFGWVNLQNYTTKAPEWWLEEIELPSEEEIQSVAPKTRCVNQFWNGANFVLNKLIGTK